MARAMTADPTHRHDHFHRGQVPTDQLADGTATSGYVPTSNGDDTVTWAPSSGGIPATIVDVKGDLIAATAADTVARLAAGANDTILMADSGQTTGLKWVGSQTPSTQAFSDSAAEGTADTYARGDHKHGMPASPGGSGTLTTVKDEGTNLSTAVVSLDFVGAGVTATGTTAVTVTIPGGGSSPTESESYLTSNVDLTPADTFVDVVSLTLNGTYLILAVVLLQGAGASGTVGLTARLTNGTAIPLSDEVWDKEPGGSYMPVVLHAWVTTSGSETWKVQAACRVNHGTALASAPHNGTTNKATVIRAIQFA